MEKKVPERKVTLKDDDIIYVYDKRWTCSENKHYRG